jgi:hypothetical protein
LEETFTHKEKCENPETEEEPGCTKVPNPFYVPNVIYANPMPKINPFPHPSAKEEKAICTFTEECNPAAIAIHKASKEASNKKEEEEGKTVIFPFNGEGDIHPSKKGYEAMANIMFKVAPL